MIVMLPVTFQSEVLAVLERAQGLGCRAPAGAGVDQVDPFAPSSSRAVPVRAIERQEWLWHVRVRLIEKLVG